MWWIAGAVIAWLVVAAVVAVVIGKMIKKADENV